MRSRQEQREAVYRRKHAQAERDAHESTRTGVCAADNHDRCLGNAQPDLCLCECHDNGPRQVRDA